MKTTVSKYDFLDAFTKMNREDNFSYEGRLALFEYLEQLEEDCGQEIELDVIALCCEYSEHKSASDCIEDMGYGFKPEHSDPEEVEEAYLDFLRDNTQVIEFDEGIIIAGF